MTSILLLHVLVVLLAIILSQIGVGSIETTVFQGMVIYPALYKGEKEITFPRARFGKFFKTLA